MWDFAIFAIFANFAISRCFCLGGIRLPQPIRMGSSCIKNKLLVSHVAAWGAAAGRLSKSVELCDLCDFGDFCDFTMFCGFEVAHRHRNLLGAPKSTLRQLGGFVQARSDPDILGRLSRVYCGRLTRFAMLPGCVCSCLLSVALI